MSNYVFPTRLFRPSSLEPRLVGAAVSGGASISGDAQFGELAAGGRWVMEFGQADLLAPSLIKAWRALQGVADNGATAILVPLADRRQQPVNAKLTTSDPFGLSIWDDGLTPWAPDEVTAEAEATALGQTEITVAFTAPKALEGGETFAIEHPTWGWRLYLVVRVKSGGAGDGGATTFDFRPPLREAVEEDTLLNFDSPRCLMRVEGEMSLRVDLLRFGVATARFVEAGKPA